MHHPCIIIIIIFFLTFAEHKTLTFLLSNNVPLHEILILEGRSQRNGRFFPQTFGVAAIIGPAAHPRPFALERSHLLRGAWISDEKRLGLVFFRVDSVD